MKLTINGEVLEFEDGMNALDVADKLGKDVKKAAVAAKLDGEVVELAVVLDDAPGEGGGLLAGGLALGGGVADIAGAEEGRGADDGLRGVVGTQGHDFRREVLTVDGGDDVNVHEPEEVLRRGEEGGAVVVAGDDMGRNDHRRT